jgi:hypothetical protein
MPLISPFNMMSMEPMKGIAEKLNKIKILKKIIQGNGNGVNCL